MKKAVNAKIFFKNWAIRDSNAKYSINFSTKAMMPHLGENEDSRKIWSFHLFWDTAGTF